VTAGRPLLPDGHDFGLLALAQIAFGTWRHWTVSRALSEGRFDELPLAAVVAMTAFMAALIGTAVVVLFLDL